MAAGRKTGGRPKGSRNKITYGVKHSILRVFEEIGGVEAFAEWATENRHEFYRHYAKLLPIEVANADEEPLTIRIVTNADD